MPICSADLKRDDLCRECRKKLEEGKITELDIAASRALSRFPKSNYFTELEFVRALEINELIALVFEGHIGPVIGKGGKNVAELSKELGKRVRIIEKSADEKKMVKDLLGEARLLGLNKVFSPEGNEYKVLIKKNDREKLPASEENLADGIGVLLGGNAKLLFV